MMATTTTMTTLVMLAVKGPDDHLPVPTRVFGIKCVAGDPSVRSRRLICAESLVYHPFLGNIIIILIDITLLSPSPKIMWLGKGGKIARQEI